MLLITDDFTSLNNILKNFEIIKLPRTKTKHRQLYDNFFVF